MWGSKRDRQHTTVLAFLGIVADGIAALRHLMEKFMADTKLDFTELEARMAKMEDAAASASTLMQALKGGLDAAIANASQKQDLSSFQAEIQSLSDRLGSSEDKLAAAVVANTPAAAQTGGATNGTSAGTAGAVANSENPQIDGQGSAGPNSPKGE